VSLRTDQGKTPANHAAVTVSIQNIELDIELRMLARALAGVDPLAQKVPPHATFHATLNGSTPPYHHCSSFKFDA
jgi:hypothetical protein